MLSSTQNNNIREENQFEDFSKTLEDSVKKENLERQKKFKRHRKQKKEEISESDTKIQIKEIEELKEFRANYKDVLTQNEYTKLCLDEIKNANLTTPVRLGLELFIYRVMIKPERNLVNTIGTIYLPEAFDIEQFIEKLKKEGLNYRRYVKFSGVPVRMELNEYKFTVSFFKSGKINIAGLSSTSTSVLNLVVQNLKKYSKLLNGKNKTFLENLKLEDIEFKNRVYSAKIPILSRIKKLNIFNSLEWRHVKYNDQAFPGGVYLPFITKNKNLPLYQEKKESYEILERYRIARPSINSKVIFFKTGSCIIVGISDNEHLSVILAKFILLLIKYHKEEQKNNSK